jgi:hypothetical protein
VGLRAAPETARTESLHFGYLCYTSVRKVATVLGLSAFCALVLNVYATSSHPEENLQVAIFLGTVRTYQGLANLKVCYLAKVCNIHQSKK